MIEIFATNEAGVLENRDEMTKGCWVNLTRPTEEEIKRVSGTLGIEADYIRDALDDEERSRIDKEDSHVQIIVDYPYITHDDAGFPIYETIPMGIIVSDEYFVTVSLRETPILDDFKQRKVRSFFTYKKTRFALQILYGISTHYLKYLKQINKKTNEIENELHQSMKNKELYGFLALEKSLVYFTTSLKSNKIVLEKILRLNYLRMYEEDKDLLEDVIIENTQGIEMSDTYSSILSGMMDAFASVISNNLNIAMRFLTSITIILSLPTMVASFYGMNVKWIPFQHSQHAFLITILISAFLSISVALIFWKKKYF